MKIGEAILDLLFPLKCPFCQRPVRSGGVGWCAGCEKSLKRTEAHCRKKGDYFTMCVAPLYYEGAVRESLLRYKFGGSREYAGVYAHMMLDCIREQFPGGFDVLTWVPVSRKRLRKRGYDQAELLARELGILLSVKPEPLLEKIHDVPAQSGIGSAEKRRANISGAYQAVATEKIDGKRILLVDDIVTTGATLSECSKTLLRAGAHQIMCAAAARDRD
jgi:competence protein ComFC